MNSIFNENFQLQNDTARRLYHDHAASLPIIDYHNHLPPADVTADVNYSNITEIWLKGDHYKWRAMRTAGVREDIITGEQATDRELFFAWARTVPATLKNPLFHWTHLELQRYFGIYEYLDKKSAPAIWELTNEMLQQTEFSTRNLLSRMNVHVICSTDDATDTLEHHKLLADEGFDDFVMFPTFRPDNAMRVEDPVFFKKYVFRLEQISDVSITNYVSFLNALRQRHDFFNQMGCRASDHGIEEPYAEPFTEKELESIFASVMTGKKPEEKDILKFKSGLMHEFAVMDHEKEWAFQMHIGALRNNNSKKLRKLGPDTGFDSIGDLQIAKPLARFLDRLDSNGQLPRTILYNLNSSDNEVIASMIGTFMGDGIEGKVQHGPAWWFHDQKNGIEEHMQLLSNISLLSQFIGMVTDSRSFLSFPRHEYFRRILCNMLGNDVESGLIPDDDKLLGELIVKLCYSNALRYFSYERLPKSTMTQTAGINESKV